MGLRTRIGMGATVMVALLGGCSTTPGDLAEPTRVPHEYTKEISGNSYGDTERVAYPSQVTGAQKHAQVYLPASYDGTTRYPALYLLHGAGADEQAWGDMGANYLVQNLHQEEGRPEMIIVAVNSLVNETETATPPRGEEILNAATVADFDKTGEDLTTGLMPFINREYATLADRENTAILGFSMGGREALYTAFTYPSYFSAVGALTPAPLLEPFSGGPALMDGFQIDPDVGGFDLVLVNAGQIDVVVGDSPQKIDEALTASGIEHTFYVTEGGHEPQVWQDGLYNFARRLFR